MLDRKFIIENAELVKQNCCRRGAKADVDRFVALDGRRKTLQAEVEQLNRQANELSKSIGKAKDAAEREALKDQGRDFREQTAAAPEANWTPSRPSRRPSTARSPTSRIPTPRSAPTTRPTSNCSAARRRCRQFDFKPLDHVELGEKLDLVDFEGGARVAGHGFYFLKNEAVLLELALQRYALEVLLGEGFTPMTTPDLARNEVLEGIGFIPRGPETQIYSIDDSDLSLVATAEITLGGLLAGADHRRRAACR